MKGPRSSRGPAGDPDAAGPLSFVRHEPHSAPAMVVKPGAVAYAAAVNVETWGHITLMELDRFEKAAKQLHKRTKRPRDGRSVLIKLDAATHFTLIAADHLATALAAPAIPRVLADELPESVRQPIKLLRNVFEHWDETVPAFLSLMDGASTDTLRLSARRLAETYPPEHWPWSYPWRLDSLVGGVIPPDDLRSNVTAVLERLGPMGDPDAVAAHLYDLEGAEP